MRSAFFVFLLFPLAALAQPENKASANFNKTEKFLPGEEVVTPTGQKMKVWSTEGPVPVSPPPQPFQNPADQSLNHSQILIDAGALQRNQQTAPAPSQNQPADVSPNDSFDVRPGS